MFFYRELYDIKSGVLRVVISGAMKHSMGIDSAEKARQRLRGEAR